ncbi:hypothetical protein Btru_051025 [Bulinus truncatus]|nr:hypothetical protein Btru_051025 [Bulinus truncatus]
MFRFDSARAVTGNGPFPTNMQKIIFVSVLLLSLAVMEIMCSENMLTPPERPEEFKNPNELRKYLKALNEYYAIVGRPRLVL